MPRIGDRINVEIRGEANLGGTATLSGGGSMSVGGEIVEDWGDRWLVKLDISVVGRQNHVLIPKSAYREAV